MEQERPLYVCKQCGTKWYGKNLSPKFGPNSNRCHGSMERVADKLGGKND
jgi:hypothetical protein